MNMEIANNDEANSGASLPPRTCSVNWTDIGAGGLKAEHDAGDYDGAIVTTAQVVQGGNNLWTPWVHQVAKGRHHKKSTLKRISWKTVTMYYPGQVETRDEAIALCERKWCELLSPNDEAKRPEAEC